MSIDKRRVSRQWLFGFGFFHPNCIATKCWDIETEFGFRIRWRDTAPSRLTIIGEEGHEATRHLGRHIQRRDIENVVESLGGRKF